MDIFQNGSLKERRPKSIIVFRKGVSMSDQDHKKILVIGYSFFPENGPRAFRTYELVREFLARGFQVDLILPRKQVFVEQPVEISHLNITYLGDANNYGKTKLAESFSKKSWLRNVARAMYRFLNPFTNTFDYLFLVRKELEKRNMKYDILISISHPVVCHIGTALALKHNKQLRSTSLKIAEYSDPFYLKTGPKMLFVYKYLDRWASRKFDFIVVPTEKAIPAYKKHVHPDRIKVIPQGFNFENIIVDEYVTNDVPNFAYAGVFYSKIRNPKKLFDFLEKLEMEYVFHLYTSLTNTDSMDVINEYTERLGSKLKMYYNVDRIELIRSLSRMDFLINVNNSSSLQSPSKLIDYALSGRPVFHCDQNDFDALKFRNYLNGSYDSDHFDLSLYDIKNVVNQFLALQEIL